MTTFVLIPGAGVDPQVWQWTIAELRELGHEGIAPPLPLDDPAAGPSAHADAVVAAVEGVAGPIVVVGQSLGAVTAPIVADRIGAAGLVLVAPMVMVPGETAGEWWEHVGHEQAIAPLLERLGPMSAWGDEEIDEVFFHDVPEDIKREAARFDGAPGPGMFGERWPLDRWPGVPTRVLAPRDDRLFPLALQRRVVAERLGIEVEEIAGGHVPMLSRPKELAAHLVR